jgi:hypothetical protein
MGAAAHCSGLARVDAPEQRDDVQSVYSVFVSMFQVHRSMLQNEKSWKLEKGKGV